MNLPDWITHADDKRPALPDKPPRREAVPEEKVTEAEIDTVDVASSEEGGEA